MFITCDHEHPSSHRVRLSEIEEVNDNNDNNNAIKVLIIGVISACDLSASICVVIQIVCANLFGLLSSD